MGPLSNDSNTMLLYRLLLWEIHLNKYQKRIITYLHGLADKDPEEYDGKMLTLNISKLTIPIQNDKSCVIDFPMPIDNFC